MKYNELTNEAKEKARDEYRNAEGNFEWWDGVYEIVKETATSFGLRIDDIYWSGFWSQGDGASFKGVLDFKETDEADLPKAIQPIYARLKEMHAMLRLALQEDLWVRVTQSGRHVHEMSMDVEGGYWEEDDNDEDREGLVVFDFYDEILELMRDYARWIYDALESEYEYLNSDECVEETLLANEYDFDEEGNWV